MLVETAGDEKFVKESSSDRKICKRFLSHFYKIKHSLKLVEFKSPSLKCHRAKELMEYFEGTLSRFEYLQIHKRFSSEMLSNFKDEFNSEFQSKKLTGNTEELLECLKLWNEYFKFIWERSGDSKYHLTPNHFTLHMLKNLTYLDNYPTCDVILSLWRHVDNIEEFRHFVTILKKTEKNKASIYYDVHSQLQHLSRNDSLLIESETDCFRFGKLIYFLEFFKVPENKNSPVSDLISNIACVMEKNGVGEKLVDCFRNLNVEHSRMFVF